MLYSSPSFCVGDCGVEVKISRDRWLTITSIGKTVMNLARLAT